MTSDSGVSETLLPSRVRIQIALTLRLGVGLLVSALLVVSLITVNFQEFDAVLVGMYGLVLLLSSWALSTAVIRQPISVDVIHWFFVIVFFGLAPAVIYVTASFRFPLSEQDLFITNTIVLLWIISYRAFYMLTWPRIRKHIRDIRQGGYPLLVVRTDPRAIACVVLLSAIPALGLVIFFGPAVFATRGGFRTALSATLGLDTVGLLVLRVVRPIALLAPIIGITYYRFVDKSRYLLLMSVLALLPGLLINNPTASARLWAFAVIFGMFVFFSWNRLKNGSVQLLVLVAGLFASQFFEAFRYAQSLTGARVSVQSFTGYLTEGHFDAYENITYTLWFVDSEGHTLGRQLIGGVLFWIPRQFWPNKPVATGQVVYEWLARQGYVVYNTNVAVPLPGEAYIDFGIVGVVILATVYGIGIAVIDARLALTPDIQRQLPDGHLDTGRVFYAFGIGIFLVHFRGSFLSTFSILALYAVAVVLLLVSLRGADRIVG